MGRKGVRVRTGLVAAVIFITFGSLASNLYPATFTSTGEEKGGLYWLKDPRMYAVASWHFTGVIPGQWTLVLVAEAFDPCEEFGCERSVTLQVFWRQQVDEPWTWRFVELRPEEGECQVQGELPLRLLGPELWVLVRRAIPCEPFLGFSHASAYLRPPKVVEKPPAPPEPVPTPPPPPPPPPPPTPACQIGPFFSCTPGEVLPECLPNVDLKTLARVALLETHGPDDAQALEVGHYVGEILPGDYQDWYKFSVPKGEARLVYLETFGDLVVDVYLVHDPCGTDLAVCYQVRGPAVIEAPCQAGVECITIPDGLTECFRGPTCGFFLRIVWRAGSGQYFLSILPGEIAP
ncbi:hypothetical protein H5T56_00850 [Candidatus Bipolaricaulota bacterium]|nr:hypothetical protein [Candidatus Bipolaricaulota bacterium]